MTRRKLSKGKVIRTLKEVKPFAFLYLLAIVLASGEVAASLAFPLAQKVFFDNVLIGGEAERLHLVLLSMLGLATGIVLFQTSSSYLFTLVSERISVNLRLHLARRLDALTIEHVHGSSVGQLMSTATSDIAVMSSLYSTVFGMGLIHFGRLLATLVLLSWIDVRLLAIALPVLTVYTVLPVLLTPRLRQAGNLTQQRFADLTTILQESFSAIREIKAFLRTQWNVDRQRKASDDLLKARMSQTRLELTGSISYLVYWFVIVGLSWYGGQAVLAGQLTAGSLIALLSYFGQLSFPIHSLVGINNQLQVGLAAADRVFKYADFPSDHNSKNLNYRAPPANVGLSSFTVQQMGPNRLDIESLTFNYIGRTPCLRNINLSVLPGEVVAIVGQTGSGKSTLVSLLMGFLQPQHGAVRINGKDIRDLGEGRLMRLMGIGFTDPILFNMSVEDNIRFGKTNATNQEVREAAYHACAAEFIESLPQGYETRVGERGVTLSSGQRQRIALARVLIRKSGVLLLDEATSALDAVTEKIVIERIQALPYKPTIVMVTHRFFTLQYADQIIVLEGGEVVEQGRHEALLELHGLYHKLHQQQDFSTGTDLLPLPKRRPLSRA